MHSNTVQHNCEELIQFANQFKSTNSKKEKKTFYFPRIVFRTIPLSKQN